MKEPKWYEDFSVVAAICMGGSLVIFALIPVIAQLVSR